MTRIAQAVAAAVVFLGLAGPAAARQPDVREPVLRERGAPPPAPENANATREDLFRLLSDYPPTLRRVLALDPTLLNDTYLAPYPRLAEFVREHPEIQRNPTFFLGSPDVFERRTPASVEVFAGTLAGIGVFIGVMSVLAIFASLARQVVDYRRWLRQSRIQTEVHTKIFDRLNTNEELLAYVQSPAGRRFLESGPVEADSRAVSAPIGRILWSVQLGIVLGTLGAGLAYVQRNIQLPEEVLPAFYVLSVIAVALGVGAVLSSVVAYVLSSRLGLLPPRSDGASHA